MILEAALAYWDDHVATFDPEKVVGRLLAAFPDAVVDPTDYSEREVERVLARLEEQAVLEPARTTLIQQIKGKARRNGPTYHVAVPAGRLWVKGWAQRYRVGFDLPDGVAENVRQ